MTSAAGLPMRCPVIVKDPATLKVPPHPADSDATRARGRVSDGLRGGRFLDLIAGLLHRPEDLEGARSRQDLEPDSPDFLRLAGHG